MPKRRREERGGGRAAKRHQRRHLYFLFDDWPAGYSIRKVDLPSDEVDPDDPYGWQTPAHVSGGGEMFCTGDQRLPPAIFRFEAQRGLPMYFAAAFDSKILAMQPVSPETAGTALASVLEHHVPVFDVRVRSCHFGPRMETSGPNPIYIPAGGKLFAVTAGTFDVLSRPPAPLDRPTYGKEAREWSWLELPDPPFKRKHVASYAVHPDGQTIFVSITKRGGSAATFAFDAAEHTLECGSVVTGSVWGRHGKWALPFTGHAHFDRELDAWVGLSRDPDSVGHLCSCDVVPANPNAGSDGQCPARKVSKEKLFSDDPTERHVGATLVYMGGRSEFCLVECVSIEDDCADERSDCDLEDEDDSDCDLEEEDDYDMEEEETADERNCDLKKQDGSAARDDCKQEQDVSSRPRRYLFRLTTFNLKYDKRGDLTTGTSCRVQYYRVPKDSTVALLSNPVAFWM